MTKDPQEVILCVLEKIKYQVDLAPKDKLDIRKILAEDKREGIVRSIRNIMSSYNLGVRLMVSEVREKCGINFYELENVLGKIKGVKAIYEFIPIAKLGYFQILPSPKLNKIYQTIQEIDENPWFSEAGKIIRRKNLLRAQQKQPEEKIDYNNKFYAEIRAKELRRQFEKLNERQKELKELEERIYSRIRKELDVPIQYFKSYEEIINTISKQLAPAKNALEEISRLQSTTKSYLTPTLQRLVIPIKQIEEQIKNFNELYKTTDHLPSETIISPDVIRIKQGAEMISELKEIRKQIEKFPPKEGIKIEGLKEGLEKIAKTRKEEGKNKFPYKLPAGTKWENIIFQFLDEENVFIKVRQYKYYTNYKEMRLVGRGKSPKPSELWAFLKVLATKNGEIAIKDPEAKTKYKKQKELLSKSLQFYFGIDLDPFYPYEAYPPYKHQESYKIRMKLIPLPQLEKEQGDDLNKENKDDLGIEEEYKKQTPEIYDRYQ